ncbi:L-aspartate 1-decarboxylase [Cyclonatronum proteinivorum]|uniref:Aspartate 1-decarboxylase n=1 Tax=Cyclonatronum proteinivorum TaxID=1457365 RepID=A0A345UK96_9BACT|nr:aspartate 1-decarboxylase [Cyclonatronum proteinivorum]AXJ00898.1 L-aspartate 1-decarboxylase [Cyclonatronum proteinivorum]
MTLEMFKSKLHMLTVTEAELYYEGSVTIDEDLLDTANLLPYEKVQIVNVNNGARIETYTIPGPRGSKVVCLNGPAARLTAVGDRIIVISYAQMTPEEAKSHKPHTVIMGKDNEVKRIIRDSVYRQNYADEVGI